MGNLVFQAASGGQVALSGPNTASSFTIAVPAVTGTLVTTGDTGTVTTTMLASTTGSGAVVLATSPTLVTPLLGTPTSGVATNLTGLPLTTGVTGVLPTANGGTNLTSFTSGGVVYASSSSALATGSALVFDGTNLGLGVTPSAWGSGSKALQINSTLSLWSQSSTNNYIYANAYFDGTNDKYVSTAEAARIRFAGATTIFNYAASGSANANITWQESFRIDTSGNLLVGTTTSNGTNTSGFSVLNTTTSVGVYLGHVTGTGSGATYINFLYNGTAIGSISQSGTTAVLYNVTSDQRLKENIVDADSASTLIDSLQVRKFDWKTDQTHQRYGFIAQELVTVAPEAVHQPIDPKEMMAVDYSKLVPMLVKEIQSLRKRILTLENK